MKRKLYIFKYSLLLFLIAGISSCTRTLETQITINAPRESVWEIFADTRSYPQWNPMILQSSGEWHNGAVIEVNLIQPGKDPMVFTPVIIAYEKEHLLEWQGVFIGQWLFSGKHRFKMITAQENTTVFKQSEDFSGMAIPFFDFDSTKQAFEMMNEALKKRAESR